MRRFVAIFFLLLFSIPTPSRPCNRLPQIGGGDVDCGRRHSTPSPPSHFRYACTHNLTQLKPSSAQLSSIQKYSSALLYRSSIHSLLVCGCSATCVCVRVQSLCCCFSQEEEEEEEGGRRRRRRVKNRFLNCLCVWRWRRRWTKRGAKSSQLLMLMLMPFVLSKRRRPYSTTRWNMAL